MADKKELLDELARCVVDMRDDLASGTAQAYVDAGFDAYEGISDGLARGMEQAGELYEELKIANGQEAGSRNCLRPIEGSSIICTITLHYG